MIRINKVLIAKLKRRARETIHLYPRERRRRRSPKRRGQMNLSHSG
jgi:hypothetical protein